MFYTRDTDTSYYTQSELAAAINQNFSDIEELGELFKNSLDFEEDENVHVENYLGKIFDIQAYSRIIEKARRSI